MWCLVHMWSTLQTYSLFFFSFSKTLSPDAQELGSQIHSNSPVLYWYGTFASRALPETPLAVAALLWPYPKLPTTCQKPFYFHWSSAAKV